jgi:N-glycosylase/DNA lyase
MVQALVRELGEPAVGFAGDPLTNAFPTPKAMAERDERFFREIVRAGYRAPHMVRLAGMVASGEIDLEGLATATRRELPDDEVEEVLLSLPGIGPYAAAHVMMTLGRNSRLILDSWTRPTYTRAAGRKTIPTDISIERRFRRYREDAGLAFWLFVTKHWVD